MWIFTTVGFFSVVQKPGDSFLTVRARVASDLDRLRQKYMPELSGTTSSRGTDYSYRTTISHEDFARGMEKIVKDIHYSNFKAEVEARMGRQRELIYLVVWNTLRKLQRKKE